MGWRELRHLPVNAYGWDQGNVYEYDNYVNLRQFPKGKDVRALIVAGTTVCHSVHGGGGGGSSVRACTTCHMTRGSVQGVSVYGVFVQRGSLSRGSLSWGSLSIGSLSAPLQYRPVWQWVGSMHPTGMYCCCKRRNVALSHIKLWHNQTHGCCLCLFSSKYLSLYIPHIIYAFHVSKGILAKKGFEYRLSWLISSCYIASTP